MASHTTNLLLSTCFIFSLLISIAKAQPSNEYPYTVCIGTSNYTQRSRFQSNLNTTLSSLSSSNITSNGFKTNISGTDPNEVYSLLQCRGDVSVGNCTTCAQNAPLVLIERCLYRKKAVIFDDRCMIHYSDIPFFSTPSLTSVATYVNTQPVPTNPTFFLSQSKSLIDNLATKAASDPSLFATGMTKFTDVTNIYGMAQCTRDLSNTDCSRCLQEMISRIPSEGAPQGVRVLSTSCFLRYELYSFFQSPPALPPAPSTSGPPPMGNSPIPPTTNTTTNPNGGGKKTSPKVLIISIVIPIIIASALVCACLLRRKLVRKTVADPRATHKVTAAEDGIEDNESQIYDLSTLRIATDNFSDSFKLGEGGFGPVYKGKLPNGQLIAVKKLSRTSHQGLEELKTEVILVAKLMHRNLVQLLGFCLEEEERLLVYEYLPNGSLDRILFDENNRMLLGWEKRYNIISGIARGLLYLHQDSQIRVIHRDMKASNVLLDEDMNPKISDFGLARLFGESQVDAKTNHIAGTYGYMAPEYIMYGQFSPKSDVYSFGVLVLEIVAGRKNSSFNNSTNLLSYIWRLWSNGRPLEMVDPILGAQWSESEAMQCIQLGLLCVQEDPFDRPSMSEIHLMLNTYSVTCPVPSPPPSFLRNLTESDTSKDIESDKFSMGTSEPSANEVTISDIGPR